MNNSNYEIESNIEQAVKDLKEGKLIVVLDDFERENEGDLIGIPEFMNEESINFMITYGKGLLCAPVSYFVAKKHNLFLAKQQNSDGTNFMNSIDSPNSITGISALERLNTFQHLNNKKTVNFRTPGHLFPLLAIEGGLSKRRGHTEASIDLAKLCKSNEVGALVEIINDKGKMMRFEELKIFSKKHNLTMITVIDLIKWIKNNNPEIWDQKVDNFKRSKIALIPTKWGQFKTQVYQDINTNGEYILYWKGDHKKENYDVRVHSQCITSEALGSLKCDCKEQLEFMFDHIELKKEGMIIYALEEGRNIGIFNKINAYNLQNKGLNTIDSNLNLGLPIENRNFKIPGAILKDLKIKSINLFTNNPYKIAGIESSKIKVQRQSLWVKESEHNKDYLKTKIKKMNHVK